MCLQQDGRGACLPIGKIYKIMWHLQANIIGRALKISLKNVPSLRSKGVCELFSRLRVLVERLAGCLSGKWHCCQAWGAEFDQVPGLTLMEGKTPTLSTCPWHMHAHWYIYAHTNTHAVSKRHFSKTVLWFLLPPGKLSIFWPVMIAEPWCTTVGLWISFHCRKLLFLHFVTQPMTSALYPDCLPSGNSLLPSHFPPTPLKGLCCTPFLFLWKLHLSFSIPTTSSLSKFKPIQGSVVWVKFLQK